MTYLYVDDSLYKSYSMFLGTMGAFWLYNYRAFFHNKNFAFVTKANLVLLFATTNYMYFKYRNQMLRANLFDEYVQMRADELIKERQPLLKSEAMKRWVWYTCDLQETLARCHRQAYNNDSSDFADSELLLQDFVRRYTDETEEMPLSIKNARIAA